MGADGGEHATNPRAPTLLVPFPGGSLSQLGKQRHGEGSPGRTRLGMSLALRARGLQVPEAGVLREQGQG